jgi:hypothetical protein
MNSHHCLREPLFCIALMAVTSYGAVAQQISGTVIILSLTHDKAIVAADSRSLYGEGLGVATDKSCKLLAFRDEAIFTFSGTRVCQNNDPKLKIGWDAQEVAKSVYNSLAGQKMRVTGSDFIHAWDKEMLRHMNFKHCVPHLGPHGEVLTGLFFGLDSSNNVEGYSDEVSLEGSIVKTNIGPLAPNGLPMGSGWTTVLEEYLAAKTPRAKTWHKKIDSYSPEQKIEALGQLTRKFDTSGHVGGNIDMAVLTARGVRWVSTKKECQVQQH